MIPYKIEQGTQYMGEGVFNEVQQLLIGPQETQKSYILALLWTTNLLIIYGSSCRITPLVSNDSFSSDLKASGE